MTVLGKILVFVLLVFSLLQGWLVTVAYTNRTRLVDALEKEQRERTIEKANAEVLKNDYLKKKGEMQAELDAKDAQQKKTQVDLDAKTTENQSVTKKYLDEKAKGGKDDAAIAADVIAKERRQQEVNLMKETLNAALDKNNELVKKNAELVAVAVQAQLAAKTSKETAERLEERVQELARDLARIKSTTGSTAAPVALRGGKFPPPAGVEGIVLTMQGDLVELSIGSDAGLQKGHTMELFREDRFRPQNSKYLGTLRIINVSATKAVAEPFAPLKERPLREDKVVSQLN